MKQDAVIQGKWFGVGAEWLDLETEKPAWPERAVAAWEAHLRVRVGSDCAMFCRTGMTGRFAPINYAIWVFFPEDVAMSGHLFYIRKLRDNMTVFNYEHCRTRICSAAEPGYSGAGFVSIRSKYVLHKLAEESPLFAPIWEDLKDISPDERGFYLAEAPDADWLASIQSDEPRLFAEFQNGLGAAIAGMRSVEQDATARRCLESFGRIQDSNPFEVVKSTFEKMIGCSPWFWEFWESYVRYLLDQGMPDWAYDTLGVAQKIYPDCLMLDKLGALCCLDLQDWNRAERHLKRFWGVNPWDPFVMYGFARVAIMQKEYQLAANLYKEIMEHGITPYPAMVDYGVALSTLGRFEEALALYRQLDATHGPQPIIFNNIGMTLASLGCPREGLDYCRRALAIEPSFRFALDTLGFIYLKQGQYGEAIPALLRAIELEPNYPDAWRHLLHAYHNAGQTEKLAGAKAWVGDILPGELARFEKEMGLELSD